MGIWASGGDAGTGRVVRGGSQGAAALGSPAGQDSEEASLFWEQPVEVGQMPAA